MEVFATDHKRKLFLPVDHITLQGAGHNDVELYNQYLERLKTFVSTELTNWRGPKDPKSPELLNAKKLEEKKEGDGGSTSNAHVRTDWEALSECRSIYPTALTKQEISK